MKKERKTRNHRNHRVHREKYCVLKMNILIKILQEISFHGIASLLENEVLVELTVLEVLHSIYKSQLLTYLRSMDKRVGLLPNFM